MFRLLSQSDLSRCVAGRKLKCDNVPTEEQNEGGDMKTKTLKRQCRDLGELIIQLQDTHSEIKVAIIKGDLGTASMYAHDLADDMAAFAKDDAIQMTKAIDSFQDDDSDDESEGDAPSKRTPADKGIAASKADALHGQLVEGINELADKVIKLRKEWDRAGYAQDDAVKNDLLVLAIGIAEGLATTDSDPYTDYTTMRGLADEAQELTENLEDIANNYESEA